MPVILGCVMILIVLLHYEIRKNSVDPKLTAEEFFNREMEANTTRKKDISDLPYLTADCSRLPDLSELPDEEGEIDALVKSLNKLDDHKLLNLSELSNTDLKLTYGAGNFPVLSQCDSDFTLFTRKLNALGQLLFDHSQISEARLVLEYAVELGSDIIATYRILGKIYVTLKDSDALETLKSKAEALPESVRELVCNSLMTLSI